MGSHGAGGSLVLKLCFRLRCDHNVSYLLDDAITKVLLFHRILLLDWRTFIKIK